MDEVNPNRIYTSYNINTLSYGRGDTIHNGNNQNP